MNDRYLSIIGATAGLIGAITGILSLVITYNSFKNDKVILVMDAYYVHEEGMPIEHDYSIDLILRNKGKRSIDITSIAIFYPIYNFDLVNDPLPPFNENYFWFPINKKTLKLNENEEKILSMSFRDEGSKFVKKRIRDNNYNTFIVVKDSRGRTHRVPLSPDRVKTFII